MSSSSSVGTFAAVRQVPEAALPRRGDLRRQPQVLLLRCMIFDIDPEVFDEHAAQSDQRRMPAGGLIVLDQRAVVSAVGEVQLATSDQRFFESDSIAVRVTWRIGWAVMSPARIRRLTIA